MANGNNKPARRESQPPKKAAGSPVFRVAEGRIAEGSIGAGEGALDPLASRVVMAMQSRSGPLPSGAEFASYEQTHAGAADRILTMTEKEQDARLFENKVKLFAGYAIAATGQAASIWLVYGFLEKSYDLAMHGHEGTAIAYATTSIATILTAFFGGRFLTAKAGAKSKEE
jgi:uncharacterized membrane protein